MALIDIETKDGVLAWIDQRGPIEHGPMFKDTMGHLRDLKDAGILELEYDSRDVLVWRRPSGKRS